MKVLVASWGGAAFVPAGCAGRPGTEPAKIDLLRSMGTWRVIACTDDPVEKKFADATESYSFSGSKRAAVAPPSKKIGWLLARDATVSDKTWNHFLHRFGSLGYDTSRFVKVPLPVKP